MLTFRQFQATRREALIDDGGDEAEQGERAYVYAGGLHIRIKEDAFELTLDRSIYSSTDLPLLERDLYAFAILAGVNGSYF